MNELVEEYTIVIVTHNMQQAARVSDKTAFFTVAGWTRRALRRPGRAGRHEQIFTDPGDKRTEDYITGRFG